MRLQLPIGRNLRKWHRWYAWYPVLIGNEFFWLETVERQIHPGGFGDNATYFRVCSTRREKEKIMSKAVTREDGWYGVRVANDDWVVAAWKHGDWWFEGACVSVREVGDRLSLGPARATHFTEDETAKQPSAWIPETNPVLLARLSKLGEECNECGAIQARCAIQGILEHDPDTGEQNIVALYKELADVRASGDIMRAAVEEIALRHDVALPSFEARVARKVTHKRG
jgi:hypothetical protein